MSTVIRSFALLVSVLLLQSFTPANVPYKIGDAVSDFSLKNIDGKMVSMNNYPAAKGFIIVFTCNHCPYAQRYQDRVNALNKMFADKGFPVIAISSNDVQSVPEDSYDNMIKRAKEKKYTYPYLYDETQEIAKAFGALKTPHAFVVVKENDKLVLKYAGAIDDNTEYPEKATHRYVEEAVAAILAHKPVPIETTKSIGCGIKWKS